MPAETTLIRRRRRPRGRSDDALVARVRAGDDRAFELLYDRHAGGLLAFCAHMLGSRDEAEDALQHTFMSAYGALRSGDGQIRLKPWLYTIARNRCLSALRARREHVAFDETLAPTDGLAAELDRRASLRGLLGDLARLPDDQRAALVLFELGDHTHDEIAEVLGVRREKVKALVFQARESLAGWRRARETPCVEIREQLATARGAELKRATLRRHVERCPSCREFEGEVRRQHAAMAAMLPIVPSAALKSAVLSSIIGGGGAAAAGGGAAAGLAAKTLVCAVIAGGAGSAGYVAVHELETPHRGAPKQAQAAQAPRASPAKTVAARPLAPATVAATRPIAARTTSAPARAKQRHRRSVPSGRAGDARGKARGHRVKEPRLAPADRASKKAAKRGQERPRRARMQSGGARATPQQARATPQQARAKPQQARAKPPRAHAQPRQARAAKPAKRVRAHQSSQQQAGASGGGGHDSGGGSRHAGVSPR